MRQCLLLAVWATGVLSSPCKPARDVTRNYHDLPTALSTYLIPTQPVHDTAAETHTAGGSHGDDEGVPVSIYSTETFTGGSRSHTIKLPEGSVTVDPVSPSETTIANEDTPETSQASDIPDIAGSQTSHGAEITDGGKASSVPTNEAGQPGQTGSDATGTETTTFGGNSNTPLPETGAATDIAGQPSDDATNTGTPSDESSLADNISTTRAETSLSGGDATQLPSAGIATGVDGQPSSDVEITETPASNAFSFSDGVAATETATDAPSETSDSGPDTESAVDETVPTEGTPGTISTGDATGSVSPTVGQPDATGDSTDGIADVPGTTQDSGSTETGSPGSPDKTISPSGNTATETEQSHGSSADVTDTPPVETEGPGDATSLTTTDTRAVNTGTASAGVGNTSQDISGTTDVAPEQSSVLVPGNTDFSEQSTGSGTGDLSAPTDADISTEMDDVPTDIATGRETTVDSPEQTSPTTQQIQHSGSDETTDLASDNDSTAGATTEGVQPSQTAIATRSVTDNSDTTPVEISSDNDGPSTVIDATTTDAAIITDGNNETPSTTAPTGNGPSVTLNPAPVASTTSQDTIFPTITDTPKGFAPSTVSGHPEWTSNTWITTTSGDSSEPTIVPVLVGCKKCGGSGSGIILWNYPKTTDTWFKLPGLPKFTFPCIPPGCSTPPTTSDSNNNDDDNDEDDEPSSTTCIDQATVTDCFVACTTYTGPAGASITPECSTTCTATHTGCSVTGTTTTSSAAACGPSGDNSCRICANDEFDDTDTDFLERRDNYLGKRGGPDRRPVGGCPAFAIEPEFPAYPGGKTVLNNDAAIVSKNSPLKDIKRWWLTTRDSQCMPVLRGNLDAATFIKDRRNPATHGEATIDHVYEKNMLLQFWNEIIDPNGSPVKGMSTGGPRQKINCQGMESYGGATKKSKKRLLQKVYDTSPGGTVGGKNKITVNNAHYLEDFIGMDHWTNGDAKAFVANPYMVKEQGDKWSDAQNDITASTSDRDAEKLITQKFKLLERMAIGVEMFSAPEAIDSLIRHNQRIYARLTDMDNEAKGCMNDPAVKNGLWSFADRYKTFMQTRFNGPDPWSINTEVEDAKTKIINKLKTDLVAAVNIRTKNAAGWTGKIADWNMNLASFNDPTRQWAIPEPAWVWTWIKKRDGEESGLSCDRPIPSDTTTSEESTTFATSTRTSSEESSSGESSSSMEEQTSSSEEMITSTTEDSVQLTDFPTLTNAPPLSISTPDGSSCASTATYTQCNLGTGNHGGACVTNSQCASWVNTEITSTTATPTPTMESPDPSQNIKHCYDDGLKVSYDSITVNAESFCNKVVAKNKDNGYYWSNDKLEEKLLPGGGGRGYHFKALFAVKEGCLWKADFDECMRYMKVPIDSCDCSAKGNKQGGWVDNNCITAKIDPNKGD
ncbi:hypothetical protein FSPOR_8398 [Fusarium sporotrichioides]|uniref:Uncharacterized protein n=1 Tax=Fusarium sporotrichioides TaxID=5514 RepID=A0A395RUK8_FUSSP|nr:hypothetical protein FSPOR_8398 [Fusarium sporotrichioides]